ncbi:MULTISPECIES: gas vesicle protein GvpO [Halobacillus]|uniref:Gas vesicle protein GvpR n=1 Tax=Halobacillus halophilus (strain ATCC 35676 / DSM 2266 / JCM 20832 / KCTC 3685 / LMG 17431 / NBRC 102448 / NCIMB 2269) TaxID=866895 RepID=I0JQQ7_HALH3|nr:gas vesicle protein GvpO [Halobacillus halophilus]ASF40487.1 gas vesicle protein GvpR [Halobacillus halophilus]CCG46477.1 gas vesicle protein GvpR [Halobacillus halophilus DSM 2266]
MKLLDNVTQFFNQNIAPPHKIISAKKQDDGWRALVEIIEEKEYMKKYANDQMIGLYEVFLDNNHEVTGFSRISLRYRSDLEEKTEVEH